MFTKEDENTLVWAVVNGKARTVADLLARGGDVNHADSYYTLTAYAARHGQIECLKTILLYRPDLDVLSSEGCRGTALHCAAEKGHAECVRLLLEAGASRDILCAQGKHTAEELARRHHHHDIARQIREFVPKNEPVVSPVPEKTLPASVYINHLFDAVKQKKREVVTDLLYQGLDVNIRDGSGRNLLFYAIQNKDIPLINLLVERGADINSDICGLTALMTAVFIDSVEVVETLLLHGANPHTKRSDGKTAADIARTRSREDIAEMIEAFMQPFDKASEVTLTRSFGNRVLQETFNFVSHERISLLRKSKYGAVEAMAREGFGVIEDHAAIESAYETYKKQGGKIPPEDALPSLLAHRTIKFKKD